MKKLFTAVVALLFVATTSAQVVKQFDFENGNTEGWKCWANKTNNIVQTDVKSGKNAMDVAVGTYFQFNTKEPKTTYKISADVFDKWGNAEVMAKVEYYDKKENKMVEVKVQPMAKAKGHSHFTFNFKTKVVAMHRVTFYSPKGRFQLDNVKVELMAK
ncbi:MAG: hypothetical protein SNH01_08940 [Rikenellaceae bacterium]